MDKRLALICFILVSFYQFGFSQKKKEVKPGNKFPYFDSNLSIQERVDDLLKKMTLEEKVGQMTQINFTLIKKDSGDMVIDTAKVGALIRKHHIGSFLNGYPATPLQTFKFVDGMQKAAIRNSRLQIPIIYGIDHVHGAAFLKGGSAFPHNINIAATFNPEIAADAGKSTAVETADLGHHWVFSPVLDLGRNPYWSRFYETFGEDPLVTSIMGTSYIKALQAPNNSVPFKQAACAKHFLGYSDPRSGWDRSPAEISDQKLFEFFSPSFQSAFDAGVKTVMINSAEINGVPVHSSYKILTDLLRNRMGFKGVAVTDWEDIIKLYTIHKVAENYKEAVYQAITAGVDMSMTPYDTEFNKHLIELVKEGRISEDRINLSVRRILTLKFDLGLFENPYPRNDRFSKIGSVEIKNKNFLAASESIVLLKNDSILPLSKGVKSILVVGPMANEKIYLGGGWTFSWLGNQEAKYPADMPTLFTAIKSEFNNSTVSYVDSKKISKKELLSYTDKANVIIVAAGEEPYTEGVGNINDLTLNEEQLDLIHKLQETGKPIILILIEGRPRIITKIYDPSKAIIFAGLPGLEGGRAIAKILSGEVNPSGKLPFTYPAFPGHHVPYNHKSSDSAQNDIGKLKYTSIADFGHGLSYTNFSYNNLKLSDTVLSTGKKIIATVEVKNTGSRAGKETVLWFISDEVGSISRPIKELKHFEKREVKPGASYTFSFEISPEKHLSFPNEKGEKMLEPGYFKIQVGKEVKRFYLSKNY